MSPQNLSLVSDFCLDVKMNIPDADATLAAGANIHLQQRSDGQARKRTAGVINVPLYQVITPYSE